MAISFAINLALFSALAVLTVLTQKIAQPWAFAIICPFVVGMFQYRAILPRAKAVPIQARANFWAYKSANAGTWMAAAILLVSLPIALFRLIK
jgi:hypothetical protein